MNILFYSPLQSRSKDTESIMEAFVKHGDRVFLLTQYPSEIYHAACKKVGVLCFSTPIVGISTWSKKIAQVKFLIKFCKENAIEIVYAQLEPANLIAVLAQYFIQAKVVLVRHHVDLMEADSTRLAHNLSILTYKLARNVVVVSSKAKEYMVRREGIKEEKIYKINLGFNFSFWPAPDISFIESKRASLNSEFVLVTAARLVKSKRVDLCIRITKMLRENGLNSCLMILGDGEEMDNLKALVKELRIESSVYFEGYVDNVPDFVAASDMMIHLSWTESSATVIKEAGLARRPVLVCAGVGDFSDYIMDGVNGFLVNREAPFEEALSKIENFIKNREKFDHLGSNLYDSIHHNFSIDSVYPEYHKLNQVVK